MAYTVKIRRGAVKDLRRIASPARRMLIDAISALSQYPRPRAARKLTGRAAWRLRVGDYRIIYEIDDKEITVLIVAVGHRGGIYRR